MVAKPLSETQLTPSEVSFAAFRKRVATDKKISDAIKSSVAETPVNADILAALTNAVGAIDAP